MGKALPYPYSELFRLAFLPSKDRKLKLVIPIASLLDPNERREASTQTSQLSQCNFQVKPRFNKYVL